MFWIKNSMETDETAILDGQIRLIQPVKGHRAGTDAVLLAACLPEASAGLVLDVGAGVGTIGLAAALHVPNTRLILLERDAALSALSMQNIALNGFQSRAQALCVDVLDAKARRAAGLIEGGAAAILTNPPFYTCGHTSVEKTHMHAAKQSAYLLESPLDDWIKACCALLAPKGVLYMVHRAAALGEILTACRGRFGDIRILPVYPRAAEPASRLLIRATKQSRAEIQILPGLVLHNAQDFTAESEALHRGRARLKF